MPGALDRLDDRGKVFLRPRNDSATASRNRHPGGRIRPFRAGPGHGHCSRTRRSGRRRISRWSSPWSAIRQRRHPSPAAPAHPLAGMALDHPRTQKTMRVSSCYQGNPVPWLAQDAACKLQFEQDGLHRCGRQLAFANEFVNRQRCMSETIDHDPAGAVVDLARGGNTAMGRTIRGAGRTVPAMPSTAAATSSALSTRTAPWRSRSLGPAARGSSGEPGTAKTILPCSLARAGGDQRARAQIGFHHHHTQREPGDDPVARREVARGRRGAEALIGDRRAFGGQAAVQRLVLARIGHVDPAGKHGDGARGERSFMRRAVDPARHAGHDDNPRRAEIAGETARQFSPDRRAVPRPHNADRRPRKAGRHRRARKARPARRGSPRGLADSPDRPSGSIRPPSASSASSSASASSGGQGRSGCRRPPRADIAGRASSASAALPKCAISCR